MSNMAYCRFQNTLGDLRDAYESLGGFGNPKEDLSPEEFKAFRALVRLCHEIDEDYYEEFGTR